MIALGSTVTDWSRSFACWSMRHNLRSIARRSSIFRTRGCGYRQREKRPTWFPRDGWHDRSQLHGHGFVPLFVALDSISYLSTHRAQGIPRESLFSQSALHSMARRG